MDDPSAERDTDPVTSGRVPRDGWVDTARLIGRLPAPSSVLRRIVSLQANGRRDFPAEIPLHQAVALAAAAQAHARGAKRHQRVFDTICGLGRLQRDYLLVLAPGKPPRIVEAKGFRPVAAIVLDLTELRHAIEAGATIPH